MDIVTTAMDGSRLPMSSINKGIKNSWGIYYENLILPFPELTIWLFSDWPSSIGMLETLGTNGQIM